MQIKIFSGRWRKRACRQSFSPEDGEKELADKDFLQDPEKMSLQTRIFSGRWRKRACR
ncbi:MAG: hypothetical protein IKR26_05755 [Lachnospiraceae bacterium]|nr:hypothetical protein [Lachnospiraceae bacterium]